jgi:hypothetical protein
MSREYPSPDQAGCCIRLGRKTPLLTLQRCYRSGLETGAVSHRDVRELEHFVKISTLILSDLACSQGALGYFVFYK